MIQGKFERGFRLNLAKQATGKKKIVPIDQEARIARTQGLRVVGPGDDRTQQFERRAAVRDDAAGADHGL